MDVRGPVPLGLGEDAVDHLDDRRVVGDDLGGLFRFRGPPAGALDGLEGLDELVDAADGPVAAVDGPLDVVGRRQHQPDRVVARLHEERPDRDRGLVGHGNLQAVVVQPDRHGHVLAHDVLGDQGERLGVGVVVPDVDDRHVQQVGQDQHQLPLVQRAHLDEGLADPLARLVLDDQGLRHVVLTDEAAPDQQ